MREITGRTWPTDHGHSLVVEPTDATDKSVTVSVYDKTGDGPGARLNPTQLRALITDLTARVELITRPAQHGTNWDGEPF